MAELLGGGEERKYEELYVSQVLYHFRWYLVALINLAARKLCAGVLKLYERTRIRQLNCTMCWFCVCPRGGRGYEFTNIWVTYTKYNNSPGAVVINFN